MIGAIHIYRDGQVAEMFFYQWLDVFPVEPAHTSGQAWKRDTLELFSLNRLAQRFETVVHVLDRGPAWLGSVTGSRLLGIQIHNPNAADTGPGPQLAGLGSKRLRIMPEVL